MVDQFIGFVRGTDPAAYRYASMALQDWLGERARAWQGAAPTSGCTASRIRPLVVQADAVALGRLLDNLIGNALNHGAPPVDVSLHREGATRCWTADHGRASRPSAAARHCGPFSRLDDARTRTGSVGLGLALAEAIARAHGGSLELRQADSGGLCARAPAPVGSRLVGGSVHGVARPAGPSTVRCSLHCP